MTTDSVMTKDQVVEIESYYADCGRNYKLITKIRFDDQCGNGHNTFSITGEIYERSNRNNWVWYSGGCVHEVITKRVPEVAHLIKWHLFSTDGPFYYVANTLYFAGDSDCHGLKKGEFRQFRDRETGLPMWQLDCPRNRYDTIQSEGKPESITVHYVPYGRTGEGKERELDSARRTAIWPEATDEELSVPSDELKRKLEERLPTLLAEFRRDMEDFGFTW